jgi:hypothetical protein
MLYGERLKLSIEKRGRELGREVAPKEVAQVAGCSVQNVYMVLNNSKGADQVLGALAHARVARFLKVSPDWLLEGSGSMEQPPQAQGESNYSEAAQDIAALFDTIPQTNRVGRVEAFNQATAAILRVLRGGPASGA